MPWLKLLHIVAIASWSGMLLYLPALVVTNSHARNWHGTELNGHVFARYLFTHGATPAALVAIFTGTLLFVKDATTDGWMVLKLFSVAGLVLCHVACGFLVLRAEQQPAIRRLGVSSTLGTGMVLFILLTLGLVLGRPL